MRTFQKTMFAAVSTTAMLMGLAAKVEAAPPAGVVCTKHHSGGRDCWDNCTKNGAKITGSYHHDGLWHDGSCGGAAIVRQSPLTADAKERAATMGATAPTTAAPEKKAPPVK